MDPLDATSRPTYVGPFIIALIALTISVATSVWSVTESRAASGDSDDTADLVKSAMGAVSRPGDERGVTVARPGGSVVLKAASASVNAAGTVTKHSGEKPKVTSSTMDALLDALGPVLPSDLAADGLWCLSGGPWSIKQVGVKATASGGKVLTDSSHSSCKGVFVATVNDQGQPKAKPFAITIYWAAKV